MKVPEVETWYPRFQMTFATRNQGLDLLKPSGIMFSRGRKFSQKAPRVDFPLSTAEIGHTKAEIGHGELEPMAGKWRPLLCQLRSRRKARMNIAGKRCGTTCRVGPASSKAISFSIGTMATSMTARRLSTPTSVPCFCCQENTIHHARQNARRPRQAASVARRPPSWKGWAISRCLKTPNYSEATSCPC